VTVRVDPLPKRLGQYEILERLAQGGMGEVLLGQRKGADGFTRKVVIKRVLPQFGADAAFMTMFRDEARITAQLLHGNITQVIEFGEADGQYFLVLEHVNGPSLARVLDQLAEQRRRLSVPEVAHIAVETARALDYAHHKVGEDGSPLMIVHRDISPSNILLSVEGEVKLTDFGIARARARLSPVTRGTGVVKGKLAYMPPESLNGKAEPRSDLFALGAVIFEMLVGRPAFAGESEIETIHNIVINDIPRVADQVGDVPPELDAITLRLMSREVDDRPGRGLEVVDVLARFTMVGGRPANEILADTLRSLRRPKPAEPERPTAPDLEASELITRKTRILVVDQSRTMRGLLKAVLSQTYTVLEAASCPEALNTLADTAVSAIICQSTMPGAAGLEFWKSVSSSAELRDTPVVLLAAEVTPALEAAADAAGVFAVLPKRVEADRLRDTLRRAVGSGADANAG
jgi:serine/threonine protein kinase